MFSEKWRFLRAKPNNKASWKGKCQNGGWGYRSTFFFRQDPGYGLIGAVCTVEYLSPDRYRSGAEDNALSPDPDFHVCWGFYGFNLFIPGNMHDRPR
ncbi:hypothetical protein DNA98_04085 [Meiothermus sp. Pnk-1]|nr:hypothetical protein DNA98_04085 [Meiothermus sp. Pnk-1]